MSFSVNGGVIVLLYIVERTCRREERLANTAGLEQNYTNLLSPYHNDLVAISVSGFYSSIFTHKKKLPRYIDCSICMIARRFGSGQQRRDSYNLLKYRDPLCDKERLSSVPVT